MTCDVAAGAGMQTQVQALLLLLRPLLLGACRQAVRMRVDCAWMIILTLLPVCSVCVCAAPLADPPSAPDLVAPSLARHGSTSSITSEAPHPSILPVRTRTT